MGAPKEVLSVGSTPSCSQVSLIISGELGWGEVTTVGSGLGYKDGDEGLLERSVQEVRMDVCGLGMTEKGLQEQKTRAQTGERRNTVSRQLRVFLGARRPEEPLGWGSSPCVQAQEGSGRRTDPGHTKTSALCT